MDPSTHPGSSDSVWEAHLVPILVALSGRQALYRSLAWPRLPLCEVQVQAYLCPLWEVSGLTQKAGPGWHVWAALGSQPSLCCLFRLEEKQRKDRVKWRQLEHRGPYFAPAYEPLPEEVQFCYDGRTPGRGCSSCVGLLHHAPTAITERLQNLLQPPL